MVFDECVCVCVCLYIPKIILAYLSNVLYDTQTYTHHALMRGRVSKQLAGDLFQLSWLALEALFREYCFV